MIMQARSRRLLVLLALASSLLLGLLATTLVAPTTDAVGGVKVNNLVVRSVAIDPQTKVATAKDALTCTGARRVYVGVDVVQTVGRVHSAETYGQKGIACDGRVRFSIGLTNYQGRLGPGDAPVEAYVEAGSRFGHDFARFHEILRVGKAG